MARHFYAQSWPYGRYTTTETDRGVIEVVNPHAFATAAERDAWVEEAPLIRDMVTNRNTPYGWAWPVFRAAALEQMELDALLAD